MHCELGFLPLRMKADDRSTMRRKSYCISLTSNKISNEIL